MSTEEALVMGHDLENLARQVLRVVVAGDTVAKEIRWTGTNSGPLPEAAGGGPATWQSIDALGTMWQTYRDGKLIAERNHFDAMLMLIQLGRMPAPSPA